MEPLSGGGLAAVQDLLAVGQAAVPAGPALGWLGMTPLTAGVFGLPVAFATMVLVSLVQRAPGAATAAFVEDIRIPHGTSYMARERAAERRREIGRVGG
jgi:Na+(H+)/acetate symporter ActP